MSMGVNYFGSSNTLDGIGRAASLNIQALRNAGIKVDSYVLSRPVAMQQGEMVEIDENIIKNLKYKINVFHFSARWVPVYMKNITEEFLKDFYNVGYWVCEVPKIPDEWAMQAKYFDEIWTSSSFCQAAISRSIRIPVLKIPHPIEDSVLINQKTKLDPNKFNFLTIFNTYSDAERKNVLFTIRAFLNVYEKVKNVFLVVKVSNLGYDDFLCKKLKKIEDKYENVKIISGYLEVNEIEHLYEEANVYVSMHRAEGFGFTISDAISRGIPVITTAYSGNMDFCKFSDVRLVNYSLTEVGHNRLRYKKNDLWATPDMQDTELALKEIRDNYSNWLEKARLARLRVNSEFSIEKIGELMRERIDLIFSDFSHKEDTSYSSNLDRNVEIWEAYDF